ncbi:MAG TPA: 30S ribosomal protein S11 [Candidatus Paceibacterota bacterium]
MDQGLKARSLEKVPKRKISSGVLYINATYNNTLINLTDTEGNVVAWSTSGALGFKGAKKGTPYAASKVAELLAEKGQMIGLENVDVVLKGVGSGREAAIRSFVAKGININLIRDVTPVPHNGPKPPKPRRV